jgi:hypothetical protein
MPLAGFEPAVPASGRPHTYTLLCAATGIGKGALLGNKQSEAMLQARTELKDGLIGPQRVREINIVSAKTG